MTQRNIIDAPQLETLLVREGSRVKPLEDRGRGRFFERVSRVRVTLVARGCRGGGASSELVQAG